MFRAAIVDLDVQGGHLGVVKLVQERVENGLIAADEMRLQPDVHWELRLLAAISIRRAIAKFECDACNLF